MAQYIDKSALVAEIMRRKEEEVSYDEDGKSFASYADQIHYSVLDSIQDFINTLEVKEVDLEEKLSLIDDSFFELGDGVAVKGATHYLTIEDIKEIAKLYYEYGFNAQKG